MVALANPKQNNRKSRENPTGREGEWESVRLAAVSRRRWKWGVLAGALIVAGGVAGAWAGLAGDDTRPVAVLATDLPAGHLITAADVTPVDLAAAEGLRLLTPEVAEGMVLTRPVPAGSPLVAASVADSALWPEPGQAVVAVPVAPVPRDLQAGTTVDVVTTGPIRAEAAGDEGDGGADGFSGAATGLVHRVVSGDEDTFGGGQQVVEVVLSRSQAAYVSRAVADAPAQVVVVNPHDDARAVAEEGGAE